MTDMFAKTRIPLSGVLFAKYGGSIENSRTYVKKILENRLFYCGGSLEIVLEIIYDTAPFLLLSDHSFQALGKLFGGIIAVVPEEIVE
jgi:hypothetical protein